MGEKNEGLRAEEWRRGLGESKPVQLRKLFCG